MEKIMKVILLLLMFFSLESFANDHCSYTYSRFHVATRTSKKINPVRTVKSKLSQEMYHSNGCSICLEDQTRVTLKNGVSFLVCKKVARTVESVLNKALVNGTLIEEVVAYRPQMSRGKIDKDGYRTQLSNHSFGVAVDVNPRSNGLYNNCVHWSSNCRLIQGGKWSPFEDSYSISEKSFLVKEFKRNNYLWGGQIKGKQKDFMHFSPSGY